MLPSRHGLAITPPGADPILLRLAEVGRQLEILEGIIDRITPSTDAVYWFLKSLDMDDEGLVYPEGSRSRESRPSTTMGISRHIAKVALQQLRHLAMIERLPGNRLRVKEPPDLSWWQDTNTAQKTKTKTAQRPRIEPARLQKRQRPRSRQRAGAPVATPLTPRWRSHASATNILSAILPRQQTIACFRWCGLAGWLAGRSVATGTRNLPIRY